MGMSPTSIPGVIILRYWAIKIGDQGGGGNVSDLNLCYHPILT